MSFDLFLAAFRDGEKGTANADAALEVLKRCRYEHRAEFDAYTVHFDDGSDLEMYAGGLASGDQPFDGAMFALHDVSDSIASFIYEFSRAAGCSICPAMEPPCVLLPRQDLIAHLPEDLREEFQIIPVASGGELLAALEGGYDAWRTYRERVLGTSPDAGAGGQ